MLPVVSFIANCQHDLLQDMQVSRNIPAAYDKEMRFAYQVELE